MLHKCNILNWCIDNFATFLFKTFWKGHAMTQNQLYRAFRIAFQSFKRCQIHHLLKKRAMKSLFWCFSKEPEKPGFWNWKPRSNPKPGFWKSSGFPPSLEEIHWRLREVWSKIWTPIYILMQEFEILEYCTRANKGHSWIIASCIELPKVGTFSSHFVYHLYANMHEIK